MGISAVEQIRKAVNKHRLSGPTIFRVSCAVWGTSESDSVGRHVDMLQTVEYDRCEQIKTLLTEYLEKLEGTDEQKIQKVAELFKDWDPEMKHELLRGIIGAEKASDQQTTKEKVPVQQTTKEKAPVQQTTKVKAPVQQDTKEKAPVQQDIKVKAPVQQDTKENAPVQQETKEKAPVQQKSKEKESDQPKEAEKVSTEKKSDESEA